MRGWRAVGCCVFPSTSEVFVGVAGRKVSASEARVHTSARVRSRTLIANARGRPRESSRVVRKVLAEVLGAKG